MLTATVLHRRFKESHGIDRSQCYTLGLFWRRGGLELRAKEFSGECDCQSA